MRALAHARDAPCRCPEDRHGIDCPRLGAREALTYAHTYPWLVHLTAPPPAEPRPVFLGHTAGPVLSCIELESRPSRAPRTVMRRQACSDCGAVLEQGGRGVSFWPEGTRLYALPGALTIGDDTCLRLGRLTAILCLTAVQVADVTDIRSGSMRFVALLRVSTAGQARDGYGLDVQEEDVRAWARQHKHRLSYVVRETVRGNTPPPDRPGLCEALQLITAGKADGLVVGRLDRLARDLILQEQLIAEVDALGGVIRSAAPAEDVNLLDADPQRVLIRQILGSIAQYERAMIRLRLSNGLRLKHSRGGYTGGAPPYGWTATGHQLVPVAAEQDVRRRIKEWRRQGWSYQKIADKLNADGIATKRGLAWSRMAVQRVDVNSRRAIPPGPPLKTSERKAG